MNRVGIASESRRNPARPRNGIQRDASRAQAPAPANPTRPDPGSPRREVVSLSNSPHCPTTQNVGSEGVPRAREADLLAYRNLLDVEIEARRIIVANEREIERLTDRNRELHQECANRSERLDALRAACEPEIEARAA